MFRKRHLILSRSLTAAAAAAALLTGAPLAPAQVRPDEVRVLTPDNLASFVVNPETESEFSWTCQRDGDFAYEVQDSLGTVIQKGHVVSQQGRMALKLKLPAGFYEIVFPELKETSGVAVVAPPQGGRDFFFGMDTALSWLAGGGSTRSDERIVQVAQLLSKTGIATARERLQWPGIEPAEGKWDFSAGRYQKVRNAMKSQGIGVLEMFHEAPKYLLSETQKKNPYPMDLPKVEKAWQQITRAYGETWNSIEVWNEPEVGFGGDFPPDQMLPMVKSVYYALDQQGSKALRIGGAFARSNRQFMNLCADNGLLDHSDAISFHTYQPADEMQDIVWRFRSWTADYKCASMPLWLSECGMAWMQGPDRPPRDQSMKSSLDISMKAVECKACGIDRYFPFVLEYFPEGPKNFGMLGKDGTPLHAFASYAYVSSLLAHREYVGDLIGADASLVRARVFGGTDDNIVVLYTGKVNSAATVAWALPAGAATSIDGRVLEIQDGRLPIPDGVAYVRVAASALTGKIKKDTAAARMLAMAKGPKPERKAAPSVVLTYMPDTAWSRQFPGGYTVSRENVDTDHVTMTVRASNLSSTNRKVTIQTAGASQEITLAPQSWQDVAFTLSIGDLYDKNEMAQLRFEALENGTRLDQAVIHIQRSLSLEETLKKFKFRQRMSFGSPADWQANAGPTAKVNVIPTEKLLTITAAFDAKISDRWAYPKLTKLPPAASLAKATGLVIRGRAMQTCSSLVIVQEKSGSMHLSGEACFPTGDGSWHVKYLPFAKFNRKPVTDAAQLANIQLGLNTDHKENRIEISDLYIVGEPE